MKWEQAWDPWTAWKGAGVQWPRNSRPNPDLTRNLPPHPTRPEKSSGKTLPRCEGLLREEARNATSQLDDGPPSLSHNFSSIK